MYAGKHLNKFGKFSKDEKGNFGVLAAILMPGIVLASVATMDLNNAYRVKDYMQVSMDAAVLSIANKARTLEFTPGSDQFNEALELEFKDFYSANFSQMMYGDNSFRLSDADFSLTYNDITKKAEVSVDFIHNAAALKAFDYGEIALEAEGSALVAIPPENYVFDIVMCIDATGSMGATLAGVKDSAQSFNADLRTELGVSETADNIKVRVNPIFYRDWTDERSYQDRIARGAYIDPLNEGGLVEYGGFIDLDPSEGSLGIDGEEANSISQTLAFENFLGSERAAGGGDWPEGAGGCLNEGIRTDWFDAYSDESRDYFGIEDSDLLISNGDEVPVDTTEYERVTVVPIIVFWTDAPISPLSTSREWLSSNTPRGYRGFERLWNNPNRILQDTKLLIHFGPGSGTGWNNIRQWDRYEYGGPLSAGNDDAARIIGEEIKETVPGLLRLSS